ncbi:MAG: HlyD family efflux transporter periplasmic adaptor subunit [Sporichthyaceae bacterium]
MRRLKSDSAPARWAGALAGALALTAALAGCGSDGADFELGVVERRPVTEVVEAAGSVVARTQLTLRAPAAGTVETLLVDTGDTVTAGQELLRISSPAAEDALAAARSAAAEIGDGEVSIPAGGSVSGSPENVQAQAAFDRAEAAALALPAGPAREAALAQTEGARAAFTAAQAQAQAAIDRFTAGLGSLSQALAQLSAAGRLQAEAAVAAAQRTVDALSVRAPAPGVVTLGPGTSAGGDTSSLLSGLPPGLADQAGSLLDEGGGGSGNDSGAPIGLGSPVESGGTLATVIDDSVLTVRAEIDETDIYTVKDGVLAEVELDAVPGVVYPATVRGIDLAPTVSARGGVSYAVTLALDGFAAPAPSPAGRAQTATPDPSPSATPSGAPSSTPTAGATSPTPTPTVAFEPDLGIASPAPTSTDPRPRPGMSAVVSLQVAQVPDAVSVPASALVRDGAADTVWLVENGSLARREVRIGAEGAEFVQIIDGLNLGDQIVVRGADKARAGDSA